jgi:hypothetical protein
MTAESKLPDAEMDVLGCVYRRGEATARQIREDLANDRGIGSNPDRLTVSHGGNQAGASSTLMVSVTSHLALAIMANIEDADLSEVRKLLTAPLSPVVK